MTSNRVRLLTLLATLVVAACSANETVLRSGRETPEPVNVEPVRSTLERDLDAMRTADFQYIFVLRRKDGGTLDSADRDVIRATTADANRRVSSDDGRAFIIGSNFQIPAANMQALHAHFAVENIGADPAASNSNTNK